MKPKVVILNPDWMCRVHINNKEKVMAKKEEATKVTIVKSTEERTLKVPLTEKELLECGQKLAAAQQKAVELDAELKAYKDTVNGKKSEAESVMTCQSRLISQKYDYRKIECTVVKNWTTGTCVVTRNDTGEKVEERKMTSSELSSLPLTVDTKQKDSPSHG